MLTEAAASFPREAEQSLRSTRTYWRELLPGNRALSEEIYLHHEGGEDGWISYDIRLTSEFEQETKVFLEELETSLSSKGRNALAILRENDARLRRWGVVWHDEDGWAEIEIHFCHATGKSEIKVGSVPDKEVRILKTLIG